MNPMSLMDIAALSCELGWINANETWYARGGEKRSSFRGVLILCRHALLLYSSEAGSVSCSLVMYDRDRRGLVLWSLSWPILAFGNYFCAACYGVASSNQ